MKKSIITCAMLAALLFGGLASTHAVHAQDVTATAEAGGELQGVTFQALGEGSLGAIPAGTTDISMFRLTFAPGASIPSDPSDPSIALVLVESGEVTLTLDAAVTVSHIMNFDFSTGAQPPAPTEVAAGEPVVLKAGDSFVGPANTGGSLVNTGTEDAVLLFASLEAGQFEDGAGSTPTS